PKRGFFAHHRIHQRLGYAFALGRALDDGQVGPRKRQLPRCAPVADGPATEPVVQLAASQRVRTRRSPRSTVDQRDCPEQVRLVEALETRELTLGPFDLPLSRQGERALKHLA